MSKAQMHNGFKSAVFSKDETNCAPLEGTLRKKNSHGVWQKRFFYLNNEFLIYKKDKKASEIKGTVDISDVDAVVVSAKGDVDIVMQGGAKLQLKADDKAEGTLWEQHIYQRLDWLHHEKELEELAERYDKEMEKDSNKASGDAELTKVEFSGWLKKKSPKKYTGLQDRFVKMENNYLHYFKNESDSKNVSASLGGVSLETVDWVRPYDNTSECTTLEVKAGSRVFLFVAETSEAMRTWVEQITKGRDTAKAMLEKKAAAKLAAATPYRIRIFDDKGKEALIKLIREDIEDIYPPSPPKDSDEESQREFFRVEKQLQLARDVAEYLEDMLPEVQKVASGPHKRPARLDVLSAAMLEINAFLATRLAGILDPSVMPREALTLGDLHAMVGWLTYYKLLLSDIYCPQQGRDPAPTHFPLFHVIPELCQWYVEGVPGASHCEGAAKHIKDHVLKIFENFVADPAELLQRNSADGTFYTHAPTDIWELLHHHLSLATSTSSPVLSFLVANAIVEELNVIIRKTTAYVTQMHQADPKDSPASYREVELELLCALSNDIALHFEQVQTVIEKFNIEEIRNKVDNLFDNVSEKLVFCGQACLRRLSTLIMEDMSENMSEIFTPAWLGDPPPVEPPDEPSEQISVALATISDYLLDLNEFLVPFWSSRLVDFLLEVLVTKYFKLVMRVREATPVPPPEEQDSSSPPKAPSRRNLLSQMSSRVISSARDITKVVVDKVTSKGLRASEISVALIENDTAAIESFFADKTRNASEYIKLLGDLAELLIAEPDDLSRLLMSRINQCPPAAQAILESATRCANLRDDLSKDELDMIFLPLEPMLKIHSESGDSEVTAVSPEHRLLCGLYCDLGLTQKKSLTEMLLGSRGRSSTLRMLESSHSLKDAPVQEAEVEEEDHLDDVLGALENVEEEYVTQLAQEEEAEQRKEEEEQKALEAGRAAINFEGLLGKKSPAHNMWQDRWFKLMTRVEAMENGEFQNHHTLLWYKKKGGSVIKSISTTIISGMQLVSSPRPLVYRRDNFRVYLQHDPEGEGGVSVRDWRGEDDKESKFVFSLHIDSQEQDGKSKDKDIILKAKNVDLLLQWMNHFAVAAKLVYNESTGVWVHGTRTRKLNRRVSKRPVTASEVDKVEDFSQKRIAEPRNATDSAIENSSEDVLDEMGKRVLHMEGEMEKKSPAHNLWQSRWFKLMTKQRENVTGATSKVYSLMWYKKKGGSVIKTLSADMITGIVLLTCSSPVQYSPDDHNLHSSDSSTDQLANAFAIKAKDGMVDNTNSFLLQCKSSGGGSGDKDIILRVDALSKLIAWINCIAEASDLGYSSANAMWLPGGRSSAENSEMVVRSEDAMQTELEEDPQLEEGEAPPQRVIFVDGELEKKSPAHNLWQARYFKLATRQGGEGASVYNLMWFKKKGGSVLKSVSADSISGISLLSCARPIVYSQRDHNLYLSDLNNPFLVGALAVKETAREASTYSFLIQCKAGAGGGGGGDKDITLRTDSVDKLVLWVNSLAAAAGLEYQEGAEAWRQGPRVSLAVSNPKALVRIASKSVEDEHQHHQLQEDSPDDVRVADSVDGDHLNTDEVIEEEEEAVSEDEEGRDDQEESDEEVIRRDSSSDSHEEVVQAEDDQNSSSDSEVDLGDVQGVLTSSDLAERTRESPPTIPSTAKQSSGDHTIISSPMHPIESGHEDDKQDCVVVAPAVEVEVQSDGGSDEDIKEYRMSDSGNDLNLKPAGCSACVVM